MFCLWVYKDKAEQQFTTLFVVILIGLLGNNRERVGNGGLLILNLLW